MEEIKIAERQDLGELKDIDGGEHWALKYGDRFEGWYLFKSFLRKESVPLNYKDTDLTYGFNIFDYNVRFIMPPKIEFPAGIISYSTGDRHLGVFRFPRDTEGNFTAPMKLTIENTSEVINLSDAQAREMMNRQAPLVFNAYKIPQYGFHFFDLSEFNLQELAAITDTVFASELKQMHERFISDRYVDIQQRVIASPNFLLILRNVLCREWRDLKDVALATSDIIHIA
jgi:hypothetical protein